MDACCKYASSQLLLACALIFIPSLVSSQILGFGGCPRTEIMNYFILEDFMGTWYEYKRYLNAFEFGYSCVQADFGINSKEYSKFKYWDSSYSTVTMNISALSFSSLVDIAQDMYIEQTSTLRSGQAVPGIPYFKEANFQVLDNGLRIDSFSVLKTDYTTYSLLYSCVDYNFIHFDYFWVLTRNRHPSADVVEKIEIEVERNAVVSPRWLKITKQENC